MKNKISADFEKNFWQRFHDEFAPKKSLSLMAMATLVTGCCAVLILSLLHLNSETQIDMEAINIAMEVDENLGAIFDTQTLPDEEDIWSEVI